MNRLPPGELAMLRRVRADSPEAEQLRNAAYAELNKVLKGARPQKYGIALRALSATKDNSQFTPVTIYSANMDVGNVIELAVSPEKLAEALMIDVDAVWRWLRFVQHELAVPAKPKTSLKYPRVGIRSQAVLDKVLDAWRELVARRSWADDPAGECIGEEPAPALLNVARVEKVAEDAGFDLTPAREGNWLVFRSSAFPVVLGVLARAGDDYRVGFSDAVWGQKVARDCGAEAPPDAGRWAAIADPVCGYDALHAMLQRAGRLAHLLAGEAARQFAAEAQGLPTTTEAERLVVQRVGQDIFRKSLINYWQGRCAVTGLNLERLLRASHIKPWKRCESDAERLDVFNGLLLAPHLDALFDGGWISFDESGKALVSSALSLEQRAVLGVQPTWRLADVTDPHRNYLAWHRREIFGK